MDHIGTYVIRDVCRFKNLFFTLYPIICHVIRVSLSNTQSQTATTTLALFYSLFCVYFDGEKNDYVSGLGKHKRKCFEI